MSVGGLLHDVFPARAGMSLVVGSLSMSMGGFPRPRGDEPPLGGSSSSHTLFSPPPRG